MSSAWGAGLPSYPSTGSSLSSSHSSTFHHRHTSHFLSPFHFSRNDGSWLSGPHPNWMAFLLLLKVGDKPWKPQMPSFILFPISSTYPIYNSASLLADWHSILLGSQNKCNSRIRDKSRLPGFFCSQALVRSFFASIWEMSLMAAVLLWAHLPPFWKFLPYRIFFLADFPSWLCLDQAYIKGGCSSPNIHWLYHQRYLRNIHWVNECWHIKNRS